MQPFFRDCRPPWIGCLIWGSLQDSLHLPLIGSVIGRFWGTGFHGVRLSEPLFEVPSNTLFKYAWYAALFEYGAVKNAGELANLPRLQTWIYAQHMWSPRSLPGSFWILRIQRLCHGQQGWPGWEHEVQPREVRLDLLALRKEIEAQKLDWHQIFDLKFLLKN